MEDHHHLQQQQPIHNYGVITSMPDFGSGLNNHECNFPSSVQLLQPPEMYAVPVHRNNPNSAAHQFDMLMMAQHQQYLQQQQQQLQETDAYQHQRNHHEMMMMLSNNNNGTSSTSGGRGFGAENIEAKLCDSGGGRWPRQETLTLLEIRSRLDQKFKEANQKGPLWDEISRIMSEEHGYNQRSGKKCREKFENLYKYYKKTKEGKAGRQDGKHYRFFRQLEALYGDPKTNPPWTLAPQEAGYFLGQNSFDHFKSNTPSCSANPTNSAHLGDNASNPSKRNNCDSLSLPCDTSDFETSSSDGYNNKTFENGSTSENQGKKRRSGRRNWRAKVKDFIDCQMRKLVEKQEAWLAKIVKTIEQKEQERLLREEEWKKREEDRMDRERKFWATKRQWIEARDAKLMEALGRFNGGEVIGSLNNNNNVIPSNRSEIHHNNSQWAESEINELIQLRTSMESKFEELSMDCNLGQEYVLWEDIATRMASAGSNKSYLMCKNKWESIKNYEISRNKQRDSNHKKQKSVNSRSPSSCYRPEDINQIIGVPVFGRIGSDQMTTQNNYGSLPFNLHAATNNNNMQQESFFRFLMVDGSTENHPWNNNNVLKLHRSSTS